MKKELDKNEPCQTCGRFDNRGVTIDAVIIKGNNVLLIKRGVEPYKGFWATPGGYVGWDETAEDAVKREVKEETDLTTKSIKQVGTYSSPQRHPKQAINIVYLVEVADGKIKHGDDAVDARWFPIDALPEKLAFDHHQNILDALKFFIQGH